MRTIVAISTSPGVGGIGIVRLSGENAFKVIEKIFIPKNKGKIRGYTMKYGHIINPTNNKIIDEVLVSYFVAPKSYTAEDMCEINSHGSNVVMREILELCLENGAEMAEPGEFTKKAFLNGRIDLSQAEAVIELINSKTEKEAEASISQLEGYLKNEIDTIKRITLEIMTDIEASIDYPEYDIEEVTNENAIERLKQIQKKLEKLEKSFKNGKIIKEGIKTAIIGTPNAGKSSLLNAILNEERAIVTEFAGTTRDTIEEFITINGIPLKIIDTAGIRNAQDEVEKIGIKKSREIAEKSDLIIAIFDGTKNLTDEDKKIIELVQNRKAIIVINKTDLNNQIIDKEYLKKLEKPIIEISALNKSGIEEIFNQITKMFNIENINLNDGVTITNVRHWELIKQAKENCIKAMETINSRMPIDIIAINIKEIIEKLNTITGENATDDIINEIFKRFCLGK